MNVALSTKADLRKKKGSSGSLSCTSAEYFGVKASGIGRYCNPVRLDPQKGLSCRCSADPRLFTPAF